MKHTITKLSEKTWCISEFNLVNAYLLEGEHHAALIDTGCGIGNILEVVEELTQLPLFILLTHGHPDHDGGVYQFKNYPIYMHPKDTELIPMKKQMANFRKMYVETRAPIRAKGMEEALLKLIPDPIPNNDYDFNPLHDGQIIDLGNRLLEVIHTPGHTSGSVCFLDQATKILFSGDTFNTQIILMRQPNNDPILIKQFHEMTKHVLSKSHLFHQIAMGHDGILMSKQIIQDYHDLTQGLLDGSIKGSYQEIGFRKGEVAYFGSVEMWYQCDA